MNILYRLFAVLSMLAALLLNGCAVDEDSLERYLEIPPGLEIDGFRSARDRSSMHGPQYFSFNCDDVEFSQILRINDLVHIQDFPTELRDEMRPLAEYLVYTEKVADWPSKRLIAQQKVYSNAGSIPDKPDSGTLVRFAMRIDSRAYFVVQVIDT